MVNNKIILGWKPIGGLTIRQVGTGNIYVYCQAMIKE